MHAQLSNSTLKDARVQAFSHPLVAPPPHGFKGGVVLEDNAEHRRLRQSRYWQPVDWFTKDAKYTRHIEGEWSYAGPVYGHFGHFMSEMAHRTLPVIKHARSAKMLFLGVKNDPLLNGFSCSPPFFKDFLKFFQIDADNVVVVNEHSIVDSLHIVEAGSDFGGGPKVGYLDDLKEFSTERLRNLETRLPVAKRVYVSRGMLPIGGSFLGERYLEEMLAEEGFSIFHPEKHSFIDQMKVYHGAETLIFSEGSACHGTELLGRDMINRCLFISRRRDHLDIFRKVLKPRSKEFVLAETSFGLGSIVGKAGEAPASHAGVSLLDVHQLIEIFRTKGFSALSSFKMEKYLAAAEEDLAYYIFQTLKRKLITSLDDMTKLSEAFLLARKEVERDLDGVFLRAPN